MEEKTITYDYISLILGDDNIYQFFEIVDWCGETFGGDRWCFLKTVFVNDIRYDQYGFLDTSDKMLFELRWH